MNESNLLARARELLKRRNLAAAALVIVPLASAVPGRADSVASFTLGTNTITTESSGGGTVIFGHTTSSGGGSAVALGGDTLAQFSPNPNDTISGDFSPTGQLTALQAKTNIGQIIYGWSGGFSLQDNPNAQVVLSTFGISSSSTDQATGDAITWSLVISLANAVDSVSTTISGGGFGSFPDLLSSDPSVDQLELDDPASWSAILTVNWDYPTNPFPKPADPSDQLTFVPNLDLAVTSTPGEALPPLAAPLPATVWSGGTLLLAMGLFTGVRKLRRGRAAAVFGNPD